ncbi:MAG: acyl-CoA dehydratase activase-related protein [Candidatus Cryptobacteroides sp.]
MYRLGIDIGSTTIKTALVDDASDTLVYNSYRRHQTRIIDCLVESLREIAEIVSQESVILCLTGSVGMGVAERYSLPFIQEVVATTNYIRRYAKETSTMIDIGGEDAKLVFFDESSAADLRMNGNCAGGTGAFIDQMAILLDVSPSELGMLASKSSRTYPIASRCGVFCKTDIQNLIARNVPREDIAASIFHAVAVQTVTTLAHGHDLEPPVLLCGGPLTFIPALRKAFEDYLGLGGESFVLPDNANIITAWGTALSDEAKAIRIKDVIGMLEHPVAGGGSVLSGGLEPLFRANEEYEEWKTDKSILSLESADLPSGRISCFIGIDSGSTTTKIVVLDSRGRLVFSHYCDNCGNPAGSVERGLRRLDELCRANGTELSVEGSCSTGYGEDLVKAAFSLDGSIVETMAHYMAARHIDPEVSFILDIGGQDMKAMFIDNGVMDRIEVNEACSSGCGSFISTFARSLDCTVEEFAHRALFSQSPCDLGTRCTVFMNSKVKQVLREGASVDDISAGLAYSVVKNCLYKVLRLKDAAELGQRIVVQGGTMRNDAIVRALDKLTGARVSRSGAPELMGAYGCALYAMQNASGQAVPLESMLKDSGYQTSTLNCKGCENRCTVTRYKFANGNVYHSGNRCEKVFGSTGKTHSKGGNAYEMKRRLLFDRQAKVDAPVLTVGIPRCLNMYEEYPFWHTLFTECNIRVVLSSVSEYAHYEKCSSKVMSDNLCFPAKLVHSHIDDLASKGVDRIFMPFTVFEKRDDDAQNSYNCPVVAGYSQVVKSVQEGRIPIDSPSMTFKDADALCKECEEYLGQFGIGRNVVRKAVRKALEQQESFGREIAGYNMELLEEARAKGSLVVLLAGRPYHSDELIQHKVAEMVAAQGVYAITDDIVRGMSIPLGESGILPQWSFINRIVKAASWAAGQGSDVQFMQLTSFGCGPDAFIVDQVQALLHRSGKNLTLLKIDDVNNIGSLRLRVRSLIESLNTVTSGSQGRNKAGGAAQTTPPYTSEYTDRTIIIPFFTPFISPLIPPIVHLAGYEVENLPMADRESAEWGLKYSNNEICYPATLVVGDIVKAFRSGKYDPDKTCVAMTQTGGQCRASNYLHLIKKALVENGYKDTPVISVSLGSGIENYQPGFKVNWMKILPIALASILYSDCIARFYHSSVVRETVPGESARLKDHYLDLAADAARNNRPDEMYRLLEKAAVDFDRICRDEQHPRVGIVGEIFLKFHPFAQKNVTQWLIDRGVEIVYPALADFFIQSFVNTKENRRKHLKKNPLPDFVLDYLHSLVQKQVDKVNGIGGRFRFFIPFDNIFEKAEKAEKAISMTAQFGEGWLIAGEVGALYEMGVTHIVSLQPFGCIANHIVEKGIEKKLKSLYPGLNILSLDFDSSVSEVNVVNRLLLFLDGLK